MKKPNYWMFAVIALLIVGTIVLVVTDTNPTGKGIFEQMFGTSGLDEEPQGPEEAPVEQPQENPCIDTDGGNYPLIKGNTYLTREIRGQLVRGNDYCLNEDTLIEYYCTNNPEAYIQTEQTVCQYGCQDGVCKDPNVYEKVLTMLNQCIVIERTNPRGQNCDNLCIANNSTCVTALSVSLYGNEVVNVTQVSCNQNDYENALHCTCCTPIE